MALVRAAEASPGSLRDLATGIDETTRACQDPTTAAYRTNLPYARLQLRKAELATTGPTDRAAWVDQWVEAGLAALHRIGTATPFLAEPGKLCERAYVSCIDDSAQPYHLYLPRQYTPARQWPLIVFLHGYSHRMSILAPWTLRPEVLDVADRLNCAVLVPYGRGNTDFQGIGEEDVLAATAEVRRLYAVDPRRVYITGVSMGGMGAWNMALRHPGMYAAAAPVCGQTDMHTWWQRSREGWPKDRNDIPPFRRFLIEWDNPIDLIENARNQAFLVQHGTRDQHVPVTQTRALVERAARLGIPIEYQEWQGRDHYIYRDTECFGRAWTWLEQHTLSPGPKRVTFRTYSLDYGTAFWVRIDSFTEWGRPALVDCAIAQDGRSLRVSAENVSELSIDCASAPFSVPADRLAVVVNGVTMPARNEGGNLRLELERAAAAAADWPPPKRKGLCGPVEKVLDSRFLVVVGTAGPSREAEASRQAAETWMTDWQSFAGSEPRCKRDREVTQTDIATANLVLFGTPATNTVLARMADRLPFKIGDHSYTVGGRTYSGESLGLAMCYPNPLAPEHYVAVYSGELYGRECGIAHKHDLLPDFIVFSADHTNYDDTNCHEVAGFFDRNWRLSAATTWGRLP